MVEGGRRYMYIYTLDLDWGGVAALKEDVSVVGDEGFGVCLVCRW